VGQRLQMIDSKQNPFLNIPSDIYNHSAFSFPMRHSGDFL
jgi:hypothetical protein